MGGMSDFNSDLPGELLCLAETGKRTLFPTGGVRISIGMATCGRAAGALPISRSLAARQDWDGIVYVVNTGCLGACYAEPLVDVRTPDGKHYFFGDVESSSLWHIIRTAQGSPPSSYLWAVARERRVGVLRSFHDLEFVKVNNQGFIEFFNSQVRRVSSRCGLIDPENMAEYVATGGYSALARLVSAAACRCHSHNNRVRLERAGRAGFPTGLKWQRAAQSSNPLRIVIANADEGDPGAYMDRALLESDPHSVLEGLILASYAVGATQAYVFIRHEYPLAVQALRRAIAEARQAGLLGQRIMGSEYSLEVALVESAGAFVCGEETSMLQVIEGKRGVPYPPSLSFYPRFMGLPHSDQ